MATRQTTQHWLLRDIHRLAALSGWAAAAFVILAYGVTWPSLPRITAASLRPAPEAKPAADSGNGQGIYTGSILFVPARGELCGQWAFDNRNGAMWDKGQVNCRPSASTRADEGMSAARMMAIGKAFKGD